MPSFTDKPIKFLDVSLNSVGSAQVWEHFLLRGTYNLHRPWTQLATAPAFHAVTALRCHGSANPLTGLTQETTNILLPHLTWCQDNICTELEKEKLFNFSYSCYSELAGALGLHSCLFPSKERTQRDPVVAMFCSYLKHIHDIW